MKTDIALNNSKGYYDISFTNGDYTTCEGFETALLMSIYCEARADASEVSIVQLQRGWWGNLFSDVLNYEIGSKLWLMDQSRLTQKDLNRAISYAENCVQWLKQDNYADKILVSGSIINNIIQLPVQLFKSQNLIASFSYELWQNTGSINVR